MIKWLFYFFIICPLTVKAQYFNNRYTIGAAQNSFNNIVLTDSSVYVAGSAMYDSTYASKITVAEFDFQGILERYKYYVIDTFAGYLPTANSIYPYGNSFNLSCSLFKDTTANALSVNIDYATLDASTVVYSDTSMHKIWIVSSVALPSGNRFYLGDYQKKDLVHVNYFIIKTDSAGNELWRKYFPAHTLWTEPSKIILLKNGNLLIGAQTGNYNDAGAIGYSYTEMTEIDTLGNEVNFWADVSTGMKSFSPCAIIEMPNSDRIYATEFLDSSIGNPLYSETYNLNRGYIVRVDTSGNKIWETKVGRSTIFTSFLQMKQLHDGNFLAVGATFDSLAINDPYIQYGWLVKFTEQGQVLWEKRYYGVANGYELNAIYDFIELGNGDIMACGLSSDELNHRNGQQGWLLHLNSDGCLNDECTTVIEENENAKEIKVYPNPAFDHVIVDIDKFNITSDLQIDVTDVMGRIIAKNSLHVGEVNTKIDLSSASPGIYYVLLSSDSQHYISKLVIAK